MNRLCLIQSEKAHLPELQAYPILLSERFQVELLPDLSSDLKDAVVWCFMGLQTHTVDCRFLIHDYRSLSTGLAKSFKDRMKGWRNSKPQLRVFLNAEVERIMGFKDDVPSVRLDMGVPDSILGIRDRSATIDYDFCYVGALLKERKSHRMIDAFLASPHSDKKFLFIGNKDDWLVQRYGEIPSFQFTGKIPQKEVFEWIARCEYTVCHFPYHRPHCFQTPTKMLEYASIGKAIIANPSPSNIRTADEYSLNVIWGGEHVFNGLNLPEKTVENMQFDIPSILWKGRFDESGIWRHLDRFTQ